MSDVEDLERIGTVEPVTVLDVSGQEVCFMVAEGIVL